MHLAALRLKPNLILANKGLTNPPPLIELDVLIKCAPIFMLHQQSLRVLSFSQHIVEAQRRKKAGHDLKHKDEI